MNGSAPTDFVETVYTTQTPTTPQETRDPFGRHQCWECRHGRHNGCETLFMERPCDCDHFEISLDLDHHRAWNAAYVRTARGESFRFVGAFPSNALWSEVFNLLKDTYGPDNVTYRWHYVQPRHHRA